MSDIKAMVAQSVDRLFADIFVPSELARFDKTGDFTYAWNACVDLGLERVLCSESYGGIGATPEDAFAIARALGFYAAGVPLAETMMACWLLSRAGISPPAGVGVLVDDTKSRLSLSLSTRQVSQSETATTLDGEVLAVPWAAQADWAVVARQTGNACTLYLVDLNKSEGIALSPRPNMAAEPASDMQFQNALVIAKAPLETGGINPVRLAGALVRAAQISGALDQVLAMTVQYAEERVQFGKPIGQNQAIQHMLASLAGHVAAARVSALTAWTGNACSEFDISVAKIRCSEAAGLAAGVVHQIHGALGFTHEHRLNYFTRRLWSWRAEFGSEVWWSEQLGKRAIRSGKTEFWASLVARDWR